VKRASVFAGQGVLEDLGEFLTNFQGMYEGFKERAAAVRALFSRADVGFLLVASPSNVSIDEAIAFHERLRAESMPVAALVANRVTPDLWEGPSPLPTAADLEGLLLASGRDGPGLARRVAETLAEHQALAAAERFSLERLFAAVPAPRAVVPRLESDVHDLAGLARLAERI
jgi:anion-transporting  ArsA/GET3 family ATPase